MNAVTFDPSLPLETEAKDSLQRYQKECQCLTALFEAAR